MKTLAICNFKGGVAKTTTAYYLGVLCAHAGLKTLLVDLDPQANLTERFLREVGADDKTWPPYSVAQVLGGAAPSVDLGQAVYITPLRDLSLCPATFDLANVALGLLNDVVSGRTALRRALRAPHVGRRFDLVIVDTPPEAGVLLVNALLAADGVLLPAKPEDAELAGVTRVIGIVDHIRREFERDLPVVLGTVATLIDTRTNRHADGLDLMRHSKLAPLRHTVPQRNGDSRDGDLRDAYGRLADFVVDWVEEGDHA